MNKKIEQAINDQIREELYSSYLYLSIAAYCESLSFKGFANWFTVQAKEELDHAMGFYNYVHERGGKVVLQAIDQPPADFKGHLHVFEESLKHEQHITERINGLFKLATEENDYAFQSFVKWYIDEQVEEEANANEMIDKLKQVGDSGPALYMLDKELQTRQHTPASILGTTE